MKIIVFGDIMENMVAMQRLSRMDLSTYDFAIFTGDILSMEVFKRLREERVLKGEIAREIKERKRHLKEDIEKIELLKREVRKLKKIKEFIVKIGIPIYGVWGNADHTFIISRAKVEENIIGIHLTPIEVQSIYLVGYNGRPKYIFENYENPTEHTFDEEQAIKELQQVLKPRKGRLILVTHAPPYGILDRVEPRCRRYAINTYGEKAKDGHIGSIGFKKIVQEFKPILHIFGHIHECKGIKVLGATVFINSGSFGKEQEIVEIEINEGINVKFKKIDS